MKVWRRLGGRGWGGGGGGLWAIKILIYTGNYGENIYNKVHKLRKIGQKQKTLTFASA